MTATVSSFTAWYPEGHTQGPPNASVALQASSQIGQGQLATFDASGNAALNDGSVPGLVAAGVGYPGKISDISTTAGIAKAGAWWGFGGLPFSALAGDGFTAADAGGVVAYIATENTIGRKAYILSGNSRSIAGMVFGLNDDGTARFWGGPMAQAYARAKLITDSFVLASFGISDASASATIAERAIRRPKIKGTITDVTFTGAALVVGNTDYVTVTLAKRSLADAYASATTIATYDSRAANDGAVTAFTPKTCTLSAVAGALFLLPDDVVTIVEAKGGSGQLVVGEFLVNGKAI